MFLYACVKSTVLFEQSRALNGALEMFPGCMYIMYYSDSVISCWLFSSVDEVTPSSVFFFTLIHQLLMLLKCYAPLAFFSVNGLIRYVEDFPSV